MIRVDENQSGGDLVIVDVTTSEGDEMRLHGLMIDFDPELDDMLVTFPGFFSGWIKNLEADDFMNVILDNDPLF